MNKENEHIRTNFYIDGEMDVDEVGEWVSEMHRDPSLRNETAEAQALKSLVRHAYPLEGEEKTLAWSNFFYHNRAFQAAAIALFAFGLGAFLPMDMETRSAPGDQVLVQSSDEQSVVIHIAEQDPANWLSALNKAESLSQRNVKVNILANSDGLGLMRTNTSPYANRVAQLAQKYPDLAFVACATGLAKLQRNGLDVKLLNDVKTTTSAIEHVAEKVSGGWRYLKI